MTAPFTVTPAQLAHIATAGAPNVGDVWAGPLNAAAARFEINTPQRMAAWLAQICEESGSFTALVENLNYSAEGLMRTWPTRFNAVEAAAYAHKPALIANYVYASCNGNGGPASGDGWAFRGRGPIQITGRANYAACGAALGLPLTNHPELLEQPTEGALSAAWYWSAAGCNALADGDRFHQMVVRINGSDLNMPAREVYWSRARAVLNLAPPTAQMEQA